jgi:hypothetical protein
MERDGERKLLGLTGKLENLRDNAAGRHGDMTGTNAHAVRGVEPPHGSEHRVVVGKRLALAHEDHGRHALAKVITHVHYLVVYLACGKGARKTCRAGGTEEAPHAAAREWILAGGLGQIQDLKAETVHGDSRFDFSFIKQGKTCFLEVKGVTLETDGVCAFPDAPTQRGVKHLRGLAQAAQEGYGAYVLFVIQMSDVQYLRPHDERDPAFGQALRQAAQAGVQILAMDCTVQVDAMEIRQQVPVKL